MKKLLILLFSLSIAYGSSSQNKYDIGVEISGAGVSTFGGSIGGSLKFAFLDTTEYFTLAYGPSFRYQYLWNIGYQSIGTQSGNFSIFGGGGFLHFRFFDWFFVGTDIEMIQNLYRNAEPEKKWGLTGFLGGGLHHDFDFVKLNIGLMYDLVDHFKQRSLSPKNPSPLSSQYFMRRSDPNTGQSAGFIPIIYRITFFFEIGGGKDKEKEKDDELD